MNDERLQTLYQEALRRRAGATDVTPEELVALASGALPESQRLAVLDRVMADEGLRREYELLRAVHAVGRAERPAIPWRRLLPLAAGVLLSVGAVALWRAMRPPVPPTVRGGAPQVELVVPATDARTGATPTLAWRALPGAVRYRVEVVDAETHAVFSAETRDTAVAVPAGPLTAGAAYRWWVEARLPGGTVTAPARPFRVVR